MSSPGPGDTWTVLDVLKWTTDRFRRAEIDSPRLTAELLLASVLDCTRVDLYLRYDQPLSSAERTAFRERISRRLDGWPTAYLTGVREFWSLPILVGPGVLTPRPETELLVEAAAEFIRQRGLSSPRILDMCTGSGAVAVALAASLPGGSVTAVDLSPAAIAWAKKNVVRHELWDRVRLVAGDLFSCLSRRARFDVIVVNPPYVTQGEWAGLQREVREHEPAEALVAGPDGLEIIGRVAAGAGPFLATDGVVLCEIGATQGPSAAGIFKERFSSVDLMSDLAGIDRVVRAQGFFGELGCKK